MTELDIRVAHRKWVEEDPDGRQGLVSLPAFEAGAATALASARVHFKTLQEAKRRTDIMVAELQKKLQLQQPKVLAAQQKVLNMTLELNKLRRRLASVCDEVAVLREGRAGK